MPREATFREVTERAALELMKQCVASRIDVYREVLVPGGRVLVRVKITADWIEEKLAVIPEK